LKTFEDSGESLFRLAGLNAGLLDLLVLLAVLCLGVQGKPAYGSPTNFGPLPFVLTKRPASQYNVRMFGACGDGVADDTAAINLALGSSTTVYFPNGRYLINARAVAVTNVCGLSGQLKAGLIVPSNRHLIFDTNASLIVSHTKNSSYNAIIAIDETNIEIDGGKLIGDRINQGKRTGEFGYGLVLAGCSNVLIRGFSSVSNWGDGLFLCCGAVNSGNMGVSLIDCSFSDNRRNNISILAGKKIVIENCALLRAKGTAPQSGIDIEPDMGNLLGIAPEVSSVIISNCLIQNNTSSGIDFQHAPKDKRVVIRDITVSGCLVESNGQSGIYHGSLTQGGICITNNVIRCNSVRGLNLTGMRNSFICNNIISSNGSYGIELSSSRDCSISKNIFWNNCVSKPASFSQFQMINLASKNKVIENEFLAERAVCVPVSNLNITNQRLYYCLRNVVEGNIFYKGSALADMVDNGILTECHSNQFGILANSPAVAILSATPSSQDRPARLP